VIKRLDLKIIIDTMFFEKVLGHYYDGDIIMKDIELFIVVVDSPSTRKTMENNESIPFMDCMKINTKLNYIQLNNYIRKDL